MFPEATHPGGVRCKRDWFRLQWLFNTVEMIRMTTAQRGKQLLSKKLSPITGCAPDKRAFQPHGQLVTLSSLLAHLLFLRGFICDMQIADDT